MSASFLRRVETKLHCLFHGRAYCFEDMIPFIEGKRGLEIGGPSEIFQKGRKLLPVYGRVASLDNCDLAVNTTWLPHRDEFAFCPRKAAGKNIFRDASDLACIEDATYDFVLSSNSLQHFANPVKALLEWKRVTRRGGALVLVLPDFSRTFDHRRTPATADHMFEDFHRNTTERDLSHLPEILEKHDLSRDPEAGSPEQFHRRSLDNFNNRCLHHHVFDETNSRELLTRCGLNVLAVERAHPRHLILFASIPGNEVTHGKRPAHPPRDPME